jgi:hypothetical protein
MLVGLNPTPTPSHRGGVWLLLAGPKASR